MTTLGRAFRGVFDTAAHNIVMKTAPRTHILLACMPKSGSSFLSNSIGRLPGFRKTSLVTHYGRTEQDLDARLALRKSRYGYVCQHHVRYNEKTADILTSFSIFPIVLVRDIHDCVISLRDHMRRESVDNAMAFTEAHHLDMSDEELETFIVQMAIPWYINFYVSWRQCPNAYWVTYQELVAHPVGTIRGIADHVGLQNIAESQIEEILKSGDSSSDRMNVGRQGRGQALSNQNKETIRQYCAAYPNIDFSIVGVV